MKILLFGPQNAGKTSLMRTTCLGYNFMKVINLKPTKGVSRENFIFRGIMELNVWDAGGQERYMERYFSESQRELIFSEVTTAVFMVDSSAQDAKTKEVFDKFLTYIFEYSPQIDKVYVLLNKIDLQNSKEDEIFDSLISSVEPTTRDRLAFTPVSVKEGSAQHRLIEILDYEIQKNTLSLQRLGKIRHLIDSLKIATLSEYLLFNQPDGLLIASTMGKFESKPLEFMKFEMSTIESNLYEIYQELTRMTNIPTSPLSLSTIVYEADGSYVFVKEVTEGAVLMAMTKNKKAEVFSTVLNALSGDHFQSLRKYLRAGDY